jgi:hypothetical protein
MIYGCYSTLLLSILLSLISCERGVQHTNISTAGSKEQQTEVLVTEPSQENELVLFLLPGHEVLDFQKGDINADGLEDVILVQKAIGELETYEVSGQPAPRPLMLLLRQPDGALKLAARNDQLVYCVECGGMMGDPYQGITIKGNYFSIEHFGGSAWRWSHIITFKYNPNKQGWYLHKDGSQSFHAAYPDSTMEEKIKTTKDFGEVHFTDYSIHKNRE